MTDNSSTMRLGGILVRLSGIVLLLSSLSCSPSPVETALKELDEAIVLREKYLEDFEHGNDSLRQELFRSSTDSLRWVRSQDLYQAYRHFSVDSAGQYVTRMRRYASSAEQAFEARLSEIQLLVWSHDEARALSLYNALDTTGISDMGLKEEFLARGIEIYTNISRFPRFLAEEQNYSDSLNRLRRQYVASDTVSYYGRKILAQQLRDDGSPYEAITLFLDCYDKAEANDWHERASIEYNLAMLYGQTGETDQKKIWLTRSAISDFKAPNRDFLSLYELALMLFNEGSLTRASRYIKIHFDDVLAGDFQAKVIRSSQAQNIIVEASMRAERSKLTVLIFSVIILAILLSVILLLMRYSRRQARSLAEANASLAVANASLEEVNKIKDNYVFLYMDLSIRYLDRVEENRHRLRQLAKNEGTDALLKELRRPSEFSDYKKFYRIFDQTFLGIFPDFVEKVNQLLREEARFNVAESRKTLPTELRILATIKLGIEDSPRIASFLKCSLSTVYTYRAKLRNLALCPKNEFEERVKAIG